MRYFISILLTISFTLFADDCSAPWLGAAHSGAPGEVSCAGCHSGSPNTGPGNVTYQIGTGNGYYSPSETINFFLNIEQSGVNQFGFQTVALKFSNNANAGDFSLIDTETTRLIEDDHNGSDRIYVGHTVCGADAETTGSIQYAFNWQAPSTNVGDIKIYLAALATNHSHSTWGDNTYTQVITLSYNDVMMGDLDGDGIINILDIIVEVNIILGAIDPTPQQEIAGDLNGDGDINILDVIALVNLILTT